MAPEDRLDDWLVLMEKVVEMVNCIGKQLEPLETEVATRNRILFSYYRGWLDKIFREQLLNLSDLGSIYQRDPAGIRLVSVDSVGELLDSYYAAYFSAPQPIKDQLRRVFQEIGCANGNDDGCHQFPDDANFLHCVCSKIYHWRSPEPHVQEQVQAFYFVKKRFITPLGLVGSDQSRFRERYIDPQLNALDLPDALR